MKHEFNIGYDAIIDRLEKSSQYLMSCYNCRYFQKCKGDTEEVCQNEDVLEYDMMINGNNICCLRWKPPERANKKRYKLLGR
jgi:hypothetical protein|uniref:Uncharacterized protein n=1 Tax=Myoviridae sp. ctgXL3 TaxID=2826681 RepID=A0A8S5QRQ1_9CAUD|nr:MAG TPA: hypothetical protein [Myoviridae sp. ctgXL3]